jgi:hypothetical protein
MANPARTFGLRPYRTSDANDFNGQSQLYYHSASDANNLFLGDLVKFDATNRSSLNTARFVGLPAATVYAAGGSNCRGVCVGIVPAPEFNQVANVSLGLRYVIASTERYIWVTDDAAVLYEVEDDFASDSASNGSLGSGASSLIGKNADITNTGGNTSTGVSGMRLATATQATTATLPIRIYRLVQRDNNVNTTSGTATTAGAQAHWEVKLNTSDLWSTATGL